MDQGNNLCSGCRSNRAKFFCSCANPEVLLCENCLVKHMSQRTMLVHQTRPIAMLPYYKNPRALERMTALTRVREEALKSLGDVDRAIAEITMKVQELVEALQALCREKVEQLQDIKTTLAREIPLSLEEVERTLTDEKPLLTTQLGSLLRECTEKAAPLQLFSCTIETCSPQALLHIHSKLTSSLVPARFAGVFENKAFVYEVGSQTITNTTLSVNFGEGGSYVELDRDRLLCVGASPASSAVYLLDLSSFQLSTMPSLSTPRRSAGIAKVNARIYAFGGADATDTNLHSCEKMDLSVKRWTDMGSMTHPRGGFTPCHYRSLLYLVSCWESSSVETFNPESETFAVLPISLPPQVTLGGSVAFVYNNELCVLTGGKQMLRCKVDTEREFRFSETEEILWSNQQPLIVGPLLLIACGGVVKQFSLESFSFIKRVV